MDNPMQKLFSQGVRMVNIGLEAFGLAAQEQQIPCVQVDWRPGGKPELLELVEKLRNL